MSLHTEERWVPSLGQEAPLEEGTATHSSNSCLENPQEQRRLASCSPWGSQRVRHDWASKHTQQKVLVLEVLGGSLLLESQKERCVNGLLWQSSQQGRRARNQYPPDRWDFVALAQKCWILIACSVTECSGVWLFATTCTIALEAPLSMGFFRQEYWSRLPFPPPGYHPEPGI